MSGSRGKVVEVLRAVSTANCRCPAHSHAYGGFRTLHPKASVAGLRQRPASGGSAPAEKEYAFEMATSTIRYGPGVTRELGMDVQNLGIKKLGLFTDKNVVGLPPIQAALDSLHANNVTYSLFDDVSIEPTNISLEKAISFASEGCFDGFVAVGGGSVMDTAKAANLLSCHPEKGLMDFVNRPIGRGDVPTRPLKPLICLPTTSGTGSETTGTSVFDHKGIGIQAKIGIANRGIRPLLGLVDPLHAKSMPKNVAAFSGFDVLCHALESYTAIPFDERIPRPADPIDRPAYQGSNPISDIWSLHALRSIRKYFKRSVYDSEDTEARAAMHLASTYAGVGFGNAGCHLCHGLSYAISSNVRSFSDGDYDSKKPLIPHGLSVVITAPAVFKFTASMCPERHLEAAEILGADIRGAKKEDAGLILSEVLKTYMHEMGVVDGLTVLGYSSEDIPKLVTGTLPQERVTKLSPRPFTEEQLAKLFEDSLQIY